MFRYVNTSVLTIRIDYLIFILNRIPPYLRVGYILGRHFCIPTEIAFYIVYILSRMTFLFVAT